MLSTARYCSVGLRAANHTVEVRDLYAEGFVPTMSADERGRYYGDFPNLHGIEEHISALQRADALLLVYPTWWFGLPAMLKGWFDRVWVPGVAFRLRDAGGLEPLLMNIRRLRVVTTYGSPRWLLWFIGGPDRRMVNSAFPPFCARSCKLEWIALTSMDTCDEKQRERFLARVNSRLSRLGLEVTPFTTRRRSAASDRGRRLSRILHQNGEKECTATLCSGREFATGS
jgi:NAD(P)H dehydrogenase (quinone)